MSTPYPSRQEVLEKLKPELDWIRCQSVYAEYENQLTPPILYHEIVGEKGIYNRAAGVPKVKGSANSGGQIFEDHYVFMDEVRKHSSDGLKAHYTRLGWGIEKGNRILREIKTLGYVVVNEARFPGQKIGRARHVVALTEKGVERLNVHGRRNAQP